VSTTATNQPASDSAHPVRTTVLVVTLAATVVYLIGLVGLLVQYFVHAEVWPTFMAIGLWGLPFAFVGLAWLICISVRERRISEREASRILGA
jgi:membrane protein YdbS with pleckstrin-like domain